jgi:hypothetical protein
VLRFNGTLQFTNTDVFRERVFALAQVDAVSAADEHITLATSDNAQLEKVNKRLEVGRESISGFVTPCSRRPLLNVPQCGR